MNADLLAILKTHFGTVSSQTEISGIVAIRNKTELQRLVTLIGNRGTIEPLHKDHYPRLVRVTAIKRGHDLSCPAYGNYQPPYEECTCGYERKS